MTPEDQAASLLPRLLAIKQQGRLLVALAGPPASGKSTLAEALVRALNAAGRTASLVPMDGFHLDNRILSARGLLHIKGAPQTFDAEGFISLVRRLKSDPQVFFPVFDRTRDLAVAGAAEVAPDTRVAVIEGNYLLFDAAPWRDLAGLWDFSLFIHLPEATLRDRLIRRWQDHGLEPAAALARAEANDLPNARRILAHRLPADLDIQVP